MKIVTLEEHYLDVAVARASAPAAQALSPHFAASFAADSGLPYSPSAEVLRDLGEGRIADMDRHGITMQVLSSLSTQQLPADVAADLVRTTNDTLADAVRRHPDRFAAFAALPTSVPEAAAAELERCVGELGFVGTMIMGRTEDEFLSAPRFDPILRAAAALRVPIYLHPGVPPQATSASNYEGLDPLVTARFQTAAWGWHQETAVHFLQLVLGGVFDRYPDLQVILGHWGELVPFYLDRLDEALPQRVTELERSIGDYVRQNAYVTPSGMFSHAQLRYCVDVLGADRIMYSVDYPFIGNESAVDFLDKADLPEAAKEGIAHRTAERLLGLPQDSKVR
ncbi:amidohydrolase family protein [Amycolatopsis sp. cmx-4-83]|uniref:amidohydrolase family protein n=1 Tax=Amycolatopsis sp. cmx-4-83 TaxID=2790940 RepID=UPI00397CC72E